MSINENNNETENTEAVEAANEAGQEKESERENLDNPFIIEYNTDNSYKYYEQVITIATILLFLFVMLGFTM